MLVPFWPSLPHPLTLPPFVTSTFDFSFFDVSVPPPFPWSINQLCSDPLWSSHLPLMMTVTVQLSGVPLVLCCLHDGMGRRWSNTDSEFALMHLGERCGVKKQPCIKQTRWISWKNCCVIPLLLFKEPHLSSASYWEEIALSQTDINHFRKSKVERGLDCSDLVVLAQNHTASAKSAWSCVCKCLTVTRTLLLQIFSCRIYLVWKSGRCSYLLLALIAQEGSGKWPLSVFSSSCRMFYSLLRCLLLENDLAAQNCTGGR